VSGLSLGVQTNVGSSDDGTTLELEPGSTLQAAE
jgi:hypothetical protein